MRDRILIFTALLMIAPTLAFSAVSDSVVIVDSSCSGVVVEPGDIILTAGHCEPSESPEIEFQDGRKIRGRVLSRPLREGIVKVQIERPETNFLTISKQGPKIGDEVRSYGFPIFGPDRDLAFSTGSILGFPKMEADGIPFQAVESSIIVSPGWSGGPLLNDRDEVIGICSASSLDSSFWVNATKDETKKTKLEVWIQKNPPCGHCLRFKAALGSDREFKNALDLKYEIVFLDVNQFPEQAKKRKIRGLPTFIGGDGKRVLGFASKKDLIQGLGIEPPNSEKTPVPIPDPISEETDEVDWSVIRLAILVSKTEQTKLRGALAGLIEKNAKGPIERKISEITGGKARIDFIFQRSEPGRFDRVTQAAGISPSPVYVLAMIKKQDLGFIKGALVKRKLLPLVEEKLEGAIIEPIAERLHPLDYAAINEAIEPYPLDHDSPVWSPDGIESPEAGEEPSSVLAKVEAVYSVVKKLRDGQEQEPTQDNEDPGPAEKTVLAGLFGLITRRVIYSLTGHRFEGLA